MVEKKPVKKTKKTAVESKKSSVKKTPKSKTAKSKTSKSNKSTKSKSKKAKDEPMDTSIVIVDDDIEIDQEKVNEERRAYLEEARSQEAFD